MKQKLLSFLIIIVFSTGCYAASSSGGSNTLSLTTSTVQKKSSAPESAKKQSTTPFVALSGVTYSGSSIVLAGATGGDSSKMVPDYFQFNQGILYFQGGQYQNAIKVFSTFSQKFPKSDLIATGYINYYLAKSYYALQDYSSAISYAKKTSYAPLEMSNLIGQSLIKLGKVKEGTAILEKLFFNGYKASGASYEKSALTTLATVNSYYASVVAVLYGKEFSKLSELTVPDQEKIANTFMGLGDFTSQMMVINSILSVTPDSYIQEQKLQCYYSLKQYQTAIDYGIKLQESDSNAMILYTIALSYSRLGDLNNAIVWLNRLNDSDYATTKQQLLGRYYFLQNNYVMAIGYLKGLTDSNSLKMLITSYQQLNDSSNATAAINTLSQTAPTSDLAAYFRYQQYVATGDKNYLMAILQYNINSFYYEYALQVLKKAPDMKSYPIVSLMKKYPQTMTQLQALLNMKFYSGALLCLQNSPIPKANPVLNSYLTILIAQAQGNYGNALNIAITNFQNFYAYKNLFPLLFPPYYENAVESAAKATGLPPALIFAIIRQESGFNSGAISSASAYGLMQMTVSTAKQYDSGATLQKLLDPTYNISLGSQELENLMDKFNGNLIEVAASYNAGVAAVMRWIKTYPEVTAETIPYAETQNYVQKIINNYDKYNRLYYQPSKAVSTFLVPSSGSSL